MAQNTRLPPQAYTRETVVHAFNWLQSQPDQVRDMVQTTDDLVSLYLRAQRFGTTTTDSEAPVSSRNFKEDLKSLAQGLRHFDSESSGSRPIDPIEPPTRDRRASPSQTANITKRSGEGHLSPSEDTRAPVSLDASLPMSFRVDSQATLEEWLGEKGMENLRAVMNDLNMTSEAETLRLLVATGARKLRHFLDN